MEQKKDIFDKIMELPLINIFNPFYKKYKEGLLYLFFGGCAFLLSVVLFAAGIYVFNLGEITSNNISWIICVLFAYMTNRTWVFTEKSHTLKGIAREFFSFVAGRFVTLWMENAIIWLFIEIIGINVLVTKIVGQFVVIVTNYIISKFIIFKKDKK